MFDQPTQPEFVPFREIRGGIFLIRKPAVKIPAAQHYAVLVAGEPLTAFGYPRYEPMVIHRTPKMRAEPAEGTGTWEIVDETAPHQLNSAIARTFEEFTDPNYYPLTNNCEHTARYIVCGEKKSTQVSWVVGGLAVGFVLWLINRDED